MSIALKKDEKIPLSVRLDTRQTDLFVRARIRNQLNAEVPGSPLDVPHIADGFHGDKSLGMPDFPNITVEYDVFTDAGFTTLARFKPAGERFDLDEIGTAIDRLVNASLAFNIEGEFMDNAELQGNISDQDDTIGIVEDDQAPIEGTVDEEELTGILEENDIIGIVED